MTAIVCRSMSATDGCVCNTMNGADWSKRYPLIVKDAARIKDAAIFDAEVVWLGSDGVAVAGSMTVGQLPARLTC